MPGELGEAPTILLNHEKATVDQEIQHGDEITIQKGKDGETPKVSLEEVIGEIPPIAITFNGNPNPLHVHYYVNDVEKSLDYIIQDNDKIALKQIKTVHDFLTYATTDKLTDTKEFPVFVNNQQVNLEAGETQVLVNDNKVDNSYKFKQHERVVMTPAQPPTVSDLLYQLNKSYSNHIKVTFQTETVTLHEKQLKVFRNEQEVNENAVLQQNDAITIKKQSINGFIFQDVFRYVDLDLSNKDGNFSLLKNNQPTSFDAEIKHGDDLEIIWE